MPASWRAARTTQPRWQSLAVGDRVDDYGGKDEYFDVVAIQPPNVLVYQSERYGTRFSWALLLSEREEGKSELLLRFRGGIRSTGFRKSVIVKGGDVLDWATTTPMLAGLAERVEARGSGT
jgi:hypothetical protein